MTIREMVTRAWSIDKDKILGADKDFVVDSKDNTCDDNM
jgi:hypothetical protein